MFGRATTLGIGPHSSLTIQNKAESKYKHVLAEISRSSLCCHVRRLPLRAARCCLSNETRAAISNPQNSAPLYHENCSPLQWQTHAGDTWRVKLCNVFAGVGIPSPCCSLSEGDFTESQCSQLIILLNLKVGLLFWPNYSFPLRPDSGVFRLFGYFRSVISGKPDHLSSLHCMHPFLVNR